MSEGRIGLVYVSLKVLEGASCTGAQPLKFQGEAKQNTCQDKPSINVETELFHERNNNKDSAVRRSMERAMSACYHVRWGHDEQSRRHVGGEPALFTFSALRREINNSGSLTITNRLTAPPEPNSPTTAYVGAHLSKRFCRSSLRRDYFHRSRLYHLG